LALHRELLVASYHQVYVEHYLLTFAKKPESNLALCVPAMAGALMFMVNGSTLASSLSALHDNMCGSGNQSLDPSPDVLTIEQQLLQ